MLYRPIVDLARGAAVTAVEALVHWAPPVRPDVTPLELVRVAEESGLIVELDRYVLRRGCLDALNLQQVKTDGPLALQPCY